MPVARFEEFCFEEIVIRQKQKPLTVRIDAADGVNIFGKCKIEIGQRLMIALARELGEHAEGLVDEVVLEQNKKFYDLTLFEQSSQINC